MFVTDSYDNHIFVVYVYICVYMTFIFKATDVHANNVLLRYVSKTLLRPASHLNSADNVCISAITTLQLLHNSNKVLKLLQILRF